MKPWWGTFALTAGEARRWRMGPLSLWAHRLPREWRVAVLALPDPLHEALEVAEPEAEVPPDLTASWRFATATDYASLELRPALADRSVVARPELPLYLVERDRTELFMSTPVWVIVELGGRKLLEVPTFRPSDTWFGPSPREGELCYASRTVARLSAEAVHRRPARALTRVGIVNDGPTSRRVERIRLPTAALSLFVDPDGQLWTTSVEMRLDREGHVSVQVLGAPPAASGPCRMFGGPRVPGESSVWSRALERWLG